MFCHLLQALKAEPLSSVFSTDVTLISASAAPGCGAGMKETFIKGYILETTNMAEIRPEEQTEKAESCRKNLWNEMQLKGP